MNKKLTISILIIILSLISIYFINNLGPDFYLRKKGKQAETYVQTSDYTLKIEGEASDDCIQKRILKKEIGECKSPKYNKSYEIAIFGKTPKTVIDVTGDYFADLIIFDSDGTYVAVSDGNSFSQPQKWINNFGEKVGGWEDQSTYPRQVADVNGDNKADIIGFGNNATYVSLSTGSSFQSPEAWTSKFAIKTGEWKNQNNYPRILADVNGDQKADLVGFNEDGTYVSLSTGASFDNPKLWTERYTKNGGGWKEQNIFPRALADINKDGKADLIGFGNEGTYYSLSTGSSFESPNLFIDQYNKNNNWKTQDAYPRVMTFFKDDSQAGITAFSDKTIYTSINNNLILTDPKEALLESEFSKAQDWKSQEKDPRITADINGDCKEDIVGYKKEGEVYVSLGKGDGTFQDPKTWISLDEEDENKLPIETPEATPGGDVNILPIETPTRDDDKDNPSSQIEPEENTTLFADMDGDNKPDIFTWQPKDGYWKVLLSTKNHDSSQAFKIQWGTNGDIPLVADIDYDGKTDIFVWRPSTGTWYGLLSTKNYDSSQAFKTRWGTEGDIPLFIDMDGDNKIDIFVWRPSTGTWYGLLSSKGYE